VAVVSGPGNGKQQGLADAILWGFDELHIHLTCGIKRFSFHGLDGKSALAGFFYLAFHRYAVAAGIFQELNAADT
jgi:hypothetical protein